MAIFSQTEAKISMSQIEEIENLVGLIFPEEYKNHLLLFNGGQCVPNVFSFNENDLITTSSIDWFLAIYDGEYDNLRNEIEMVKIEEQRLPSHILPIAHDSGGNLVCISCGGVDNGCIYFWDHEKEIYYDSTNDYDYSNLYFVAKTFNEFLNSLK